MRYLLLSAIFLIVLTSLCTIPDIPLLELPSSGTPVQQAEIVLTVDEKSPDVFLNVEAYSSQIKAGGVLLVSFELRNKQRYELRNVELEVYDHPCFKESENSGLFFKDLDNVKANQSKMWTWKWKSDEDIDLPTACPIKFKISYEADYSYYQDIAVLPENEYFQRELEGTLGNVPIKTSSSSSPLNIQVTFSESQPFLENQRYYMYINYYNKGKGYFDSEETFNPDIELNVPANIVIDEEHCSDYERLETDKYHLVPNNPQNNLVFIRSKATPTTCEFTTTDVSTMDIKSLSLTATYKYVLDDSISVTVSGKTYPVSAPSAPPTSSGGSRFIVPE